MPAVAERCQRPHLVATLTIWASWELTPNEKIVWYHTWLLDTVPSDGCYISARSMGERLALSPKTIEGIRARLVALELMASFPRPGTNQPGWYAKVPLSLVPQARDLQKASREAAALGRQLDERIKGEDARLARQRTEAPPDIGRATVPRGDGGRFRPQADTASAGARSALYGEGVGGGVPSASPRTIERSLPPAVTEPEQQMGVGASAPERQEEDEPTPRAIDQRPRQDVEDEGFADIAHKLKLSAFREAAERERVRKAANQ